MATFCPTKNDFIQELKNFFSDKKISSNQLASLLDHYQYAGECLKNNSNIKGGWNQHIEILKCLYYSEIENDDIVMDFFKLDVLVNKK